METEKSTWLEISNAWERGELERLTTPRPGWLNNDFIDKYCADICDDEEETEVSIEEQLESFYEPLYNVAKRRMRWINRELFYAWMQEILR